MPPSEDPQSAAPSAGNHLTEGPLLRSLVSLSVPIVFSNILQSAYQFTDTFWVGRLGGKAVAAVSVSFPLVFLMISVGAGFTIAGSTLVAQHTGAKNDKMVNLVTGQTFLLMSIFASVLSAIGYAASARLLRLMGVESDILLDATHYLRVSFVGLFFVFGFFMYQSIMRGLGEVRVPLYIVFGTVLLNLVLDPLFIFGWGPIPAMGVAGAAYATMGTQSVAMLVGFFVLFSGRYGIHFRQAHFAPNTAMISQILRLGLPASIDQSTRALGMAMMTFLVTSFGTLTVAIFGIGSRILSFVIIPALGLSMATSTLVGQNMGAGRPERATAIAKLSAAVAFVALSAVGAFCFAFADHIVAFFVPKDPEVIAGGATFVRIISPAFGVLGTQQALIGTFRGSGNTVLSMLLSMVGMWMIQFPLAYVLSKHTALAALGLWWTYPLANTASCALALVFFLHGGWRTKRLILQENVEISENILTQEGLR